MRSLTVITQPETPFTLTQKASNPTCRIAAFIGGLKPHTKIPKLNIFGVRSCFINKSIVLILVFTNPRSRRKGRGAMKQAVAASSPDNHNVSAGYSTADSIGLPSFTFFDVVIYFYAYNFFFVFSFNVVTFLVNVHFIYFILFGNIILISVKLISES